MSVRRSMRKASLRGTQAWARVESVALSAATVRLAEGGARLTNLQMMAPVRVGEKVIVDFVAQDKPTVRPYTTTVDLLIEDEVLPVAPKIPSDPDPDAGEPKLSSQLIAGEITRDEEFAETFFFDYDKDPVCSVLFFPFTYVYYDWGHQFYDGGIYIKYPGRYMMSMRIAMDWIDDPDYYVAKVGMTVENSVGWSFDADSGTQIKRWDSAQPGGILESVWQGSMTFPQGAIVKPWVKVKGGGRMLTSGLPVTFPYYPGRYPILQWWRICPMVGPRSVLYWWDVDREEGDNWHY